MDANQSALPELLRRVSNGDRAAFRAVYDLTARRLFGIALRITRDRAMAADALQDAFVQIWRNAARFDPARGNAEAWLAALVRYRALDLVRRKENDPPPDSLPGDDMPDLSALDRLEGGAAAADLRRCLEALAPDRRDLVLLSFVQGLSHAELAARFASPLGTIKSSIRRALESLRLCLST